MEYVAGIAQRVIVIRLVFLETTPFYIAVDYFFFMQILKFSLHYSYVKEGQVMSFDG